MGPCFMDPVEANLRAVGEAHGIKSAFEVGLSKAHIRGDGSFQVKSLYLTWDSYLFYITTSECFESQSS